MERINAVALEMVKNLVTIGESNANYTIMAEIAQTGAGLSAYGLPITEIDEKMCAFWRSLDKQKLENAAKHIVNQLFHTFLSQTREIGDKKTVRLHYHVGQEALALAVCKELEARGYKVNVPPPMVDDEARNPEDDFAHDTALRDNYKAAYERVWNEHIELASDILGFIRIGQFGGIKTPKALDNSEAEQQKRAWRKELMTFKRIQESRAQKPGTMGMTAVTFPSCEIGDNFEVVFDAILNMNLENSEPFELIQQKLIDALDTCRYVRIEGAGGRTDITIQLSALADPTKHTNFLNGGGDVNIPYGEIFTTPKLTGTNGSLFTSEVFLKGQYFKDLKITFTDGYVTDYICANFESADENRAYIREHILGGFDTMTMGEFAIGTNTRAFRIIEQFGLEKVIPILIAEKTGPHIAIGDPCFARGESSPVVNMYDKKEVTARANERTARRDEMPDCYYFNHVDITLPFGQIDRLYGVTEDGRRVMLIENGRFVLDGTDELNRWLK